MLQYQILIKFNNNSVNLLKKGNFDKIQIILGIKIFAFFN